MYLLSKSGSIVIQSLVPSFKHVRRTPCNRLYSSLQLKRKQIYTDDDVLAFKATRSQFIDEVMQYVKQHDNAIGADWVKRALEYNLVEKRPYRSLLTVLGFEALADKSQLTPENRETVRFLAWCSKALEASLISSDDIIDMTPKRLGLPTWHTLPDVEMQAVNDILMYSHVIYPLMVDRLHGKECFPTLVKTFSEGISTCILGQTIDNLITRQKVTEHTWEMYEKATFLKASGFTCFFPIQVALDFCGYKGHKIYKETANVCYEIGRYWAMRNESLDCCSDSKDVGKTDIKLNKLTWLSLKAVEVANDKQRQILLDCYGKDDPYKVERVKSLFLEMGIYKLLADAEKKLYYSINKMIDNLSYENMKPVLYTYCENVKELS